MYEIPNIRKSQARECVLQFYPCQHCGYEKENGGAHSGRCTGCGIQFQIIKHHAGGKCNRCYMRFLRIKSVETPQVEVKTYD
jgi:hypothetical protein